MQRLFPPEVEFVTASVAACDGALLPAERVHTERMVPKRLREFTAGRVCARQALTQLGTEAVAIGVGSQREPLWPDGIVGSIAHSNAWAAAAVSAEPAFLGLGLDLEPDEDLPAEVLERVCRPEERAWLEARPSGDRLRLARAFFSAKEALFKSVFPRARTWLEFEDVRIDLTEDDEAFVASILVPSTSAVPMPPSLRGRVARERDHVWTSVIWHN